MKFPSVGGRCALGLNATTPPLLSFLPESQRATLLSSGSYSERAEKLGVPIGAVRSRLHRARVALVALRQKRHELLLTETPGNPIELRLEPLIRISSS